MHPGWIGGIIGGVIGVLGGAVGTYYSVKNTKGPKERAFMVKCAIYGWMGIVVFLVLLIVLPNPYRWLLWAPYGILLSLAIRKGNAVQQRIRKEESASDSMR
ncbi:MAG: hypothetical protein KAV82_10935 [Phycisphaerae bacterium]|nr:hypothetical protein [Phycisphaerae bacterium]